MPWDQNTRPGRRGFPRAITQGVLKKAPQCELALPGCTFLATEVDHRISWAVATAHGWTPGEINSEANAQPVCASCHQRKTQAEAAMGRARARTSRGPRHPGLR